MSLHRKIMQFWSQCMLNLFFTLQMSCLQSIIPEIYFKSSLTVSHISCHTPMHLYIIIG